MKKERKVAPVLHFFLGILFLVTYHTILPAVYSYLLNPLLSKNVWIATIFNILYYVLIATVLILIYHKSLKKEWHLFWNKKKENTKVALSNWGKGIVLMILSNIIALSVIGNISGNEELNREILTKMPVYAITVMCFFGPFIEEMIFRKTFRPAFQNKYVFALTTSFIFAFLHVINSFDVLTLSAMLAGWKQFFFLLPYGSLAFFFALSYYDTKTIFTSTLAHMFHNNLTVLLILLAL